MILGLGFKAILKKVLLACHTNMVALNGLKEFRDIYYNTQSLEHFGQTFKTNTIYSGFT